MDSSTAQALFPHFEWGKRHLLFYPQCSKHGSALSDCRDWLKLVRKSKIKSKACRVVLLIWYSPNTQKSSLLISHIKASGSTKLNRLFTYLVFLFRNSTADVSVENRRERGVYSPLFPDKMHALVVYTASYVCSCKPLIVTQAQLPTTSQLWLGKRIHYKKELT